MKNNNTDHTFVICAYKSGDELERCVKSLKQQTIKTKIIISTSTPNEVMEKVAKKYRVELRINKEKSNHIKDFIFAYNQADTKYVTLCHQDDIYYPNYAEETIKHMSKYNDSLISFSNYYENRDGKLCKNNMLLFIKKLMNFPIKIFKKSKRVRLFILSLGNPICCPSVTYNKELISVPLIDKNYVSDLDWISYIEFAKMKGRFIYISKPLVERCIHQNSLTTEVIKNNVKSKEDYKIFRLFWPEFIAKLLLKLYGTSEKSNNVKEGKNDKN